MSDKIDLKKTSRLAQLPLTNSEVAILEPQLESILEFVSLVSNIPAAAEEDSSLKLQLENTRVDEANSERSLSINDVTKNTAAHDGSSFVVKGIFE